MSNSLTHVTHSGVYWQTPMMAFHHVHNLLSCMLVSISWVVKPVSWWSRSTKVLVGRPADLLPWVGLHVTSSDIILPLLLMQWPANFSRLILILVVILGRSPYNPLISYMVSPADIKCFPQHTSVTAVQCFSYFVVNSPNNRVLTAISRKKPWDLS